MISIDAVEIEQLVQLIGGGFIFGAGLALIGYIFALLINTFFDIAK